MRLLPYMLRFKGRIIISALLLVLGRLVSVADPYILKLIIDTLTTPDGNIAPTLGVLVSIFFLLQAATQFVDAARTWIFAPAETNIKKFVALDVFSYLLSLPTSFHTDRSTGGISRKVTRGTSGLEMALFMIAGNILPTLVELIIITLIFITLFPLSFTVVLILFVVVFVAYTVWAVGRRQAILLATNQLDDEASGKSIDALLNVDTVKYFTNESFEVSRYASFLSRWVTNDIKSSKMEAYIYRGQGIIIAVSLTILLWLAIGAYQSGGMTVGDLVLVTTYLARTSVPLSFLGFIYRRLKESFADMDEMFKLLDVPNTLTDTSHAKELGTVRGEISFQNVHFGYTPEREVVHDLSFTVPAQKRVALVGYSGSGKSTISKLLLRLYDPTQGSILIDGQEIREVTQKSLRAQIGVVAQDAILFNDTIFNNIIYGKPDASKKEVEDAARTAHIHDFITEHLPQGYDTVVGERGVKLSGGEKQRVAIARMLLKNPPILIFDEATASLDTKAEKIIQDAISELSQGGRTTIVIAHRLSTIVDFDEIIVMDKGVIVERGTHQELMAQNNVYAKLWKMQGKQESSE